MGRRPTSARNIGVKWDGTPDSSPIGDRVSHKMPSGRVFPTASRRLDHTNRRHRTSASPRNDSLTRRATAPSLIGHPVVASTAAGGGPRFLALVGGLAIDPPVPA